MEEKKNGHNALENDNGKATNEKKNNKKANILDNGKYEENQLDFCFREHGPKNHESNLVSEAFPEKLNINE